jgi:hypothetical protein
MSGQMGGVDAMGGPVLAPAATDSTPQTPGEMQHHHH